ncbi:DUF2188 domain-containing protein [Maridesulfovibrio bastinii]|uniref:DUF2188 domain-containing protein n=1 Tax=Maridesulfovibrio bastinii TaxID=47157 RepID=UPI0004209DFE|nr:DUF2188 domain-containing protein [Maridesulfovibrio bastinii]
MSDKDMHITEHPDGGWQGKKPGAKRASFRTDTQAEAIGRAAEQGRREGLEVSIHGKNGKIRDKRSYGNDPYPPKG